MFKKVFPILLLVTLLPSAALSEDHGSDSHSGQGHSEVAESDHGGSHDAPSINWWDMSNGADGATPPLGFMFINFVLLLVLVFKIMRKPIGNRVKVRRESLEKALKEATEMTARAQEALTIARERMEAIDLEMAKIRKDILDAGKGEAERISRDAEERSRRMNEDTAALVDQEVARMSAQIRAQVVDGIMATAEKVLVQKIAATDQDRLAREYIESINKETEPGDRRREV